MAEQVTVDAERLAALEAFVKAYDERYHALGYAGLENARNAIPPKPEELIEVEGWEGRHNGVRWTWCRVDGWGFHASPGRSIADANAALRGFVRAAAKAVQP